MNLQLNRKTDYSLFQNPKVAKKAYRRYLIQQFFSIYTSLSFILSLICLCLLEWFHWSVFITVGKGIFFGGFVYGFIICLTLYVFDLRSANKAIISPIAFICTDGYVINAFFYYEDNNGQLIIDYCSFTKKDIQFVDCEHIGQLEQFFTENGHTTDVLYLSKKYMMTE